MSAWRLLAQVALYVPLMALIGVFSTWPRFELIGADEALLRLTLVHAAERLRPCRTRSAAELAKLAPNMRAALDCTRERAPLLVELELDGALVLRRTLPPAGLRRDGAASLYLRLPLRAGRHRVAVRLRDRAEGAFTHRFAREVELAAGGALLIDFAPAEGGFVIRG